MFDDDIDTALHIMQCQINHFVSKHFSAANKSELIETISWSTIEFEIEWTKWIWSKHYVVTMLCIVDIAHDFAGAVIELCQNNGTCRDINWYVINVLVNLPYHFTTIMTILKENDYNSAVLCKCQQIPPLDVQFR